jgi:tetratricopeptide (TPR) repeat protein
MKEALPANPALEAAQAMCTEGITLTAKGLADEALLKYNTLLEQFGLRRKIEFIRVLATAMYNKGTVLGTQERHGEAIAAYDALIKRFGHNASEPALDVIALKAMRNKAYRLNVLGKGDASIAVFEDIMQQFGARKSPEIQAHVAPVKAFLAERQAVLDARQQATRA